MHALPADKAAIDYLVQQQLEAYNARDIEAFMDCWAAECQCFLFPSHLIAQGTAEVRARYVARFEEPNLHAKILARMIVGNLVIDHEHITRTFPGGPGEIEVIAIYEIDGGKIAKAWFKMGEPRLYNR